MTIPEKTGIWDLDEAIRQMAKKMMDERFIQSVRNVCVDGHKFEASLTVSQDHNGYMVNVNLYSRKKTGTLGTLLRLNDGDKK